MTVCIAAICAWNSDDYKGEMVVCASDRLLSAPDLKYEPAQKKAYQFFPWVVALIAGDPYAQTTICNRTSAFFTKYPQRAGSVEDVAKAYAESFTQYRREAAETRLLKPMGLDAEALLVRQDEFPSHFVEKRLQELQFSELGVQTIITGIDQTGPHIFVVNDPGTYECHDAIGFAAIGTGKPHAESQFMLAKHTRFEDWRKTLMLAYVAKKRAEVSPTVGTLTDLMFISQFGGTTTLPQVGEVSVDIQNGFKKLYDGFETSVDWVTRQLFHDAGAFLDAELHRHAQPQTPQTQLPESAESIPAPPPDQAPTSKHPKRAARKKQKPAADKPEKPATSS